MQECLTPETTIELLEACKKGAPPKMGRWGSLPMNGQVSCEGEYRRLSIWYHGQEHDRAVDALVRAGPLGKTSLKEEPPAPGFMMRKDLEKKVDPASVKKEMHY